MRIDILTLFPEMFSPLEYSVIGRARQKGILEINIVDIRDFSADKHKKCDDYPFGGGAGMVMMPQPVHDCVNAVDPDRQALRIYLSPKGEKLTQKRWLSFPGGRDCFFFADITRASTKECWIWISTAKFP